jgi:hypothetical protein
MHSQTLRFTQRIVFLFTNMLFMHVRYHIALLTEHAVLNV